MYVSAERISDALVHFRQAIDGLEKRKFQHEQAAIIVSNLTNHLEKLKHADEAESWLRKWLVALRERTAAEEPDYDRVMAMLGRNLLLQSKHSDAEVVLRECLAVRQQTRPNEWTTANTKSMLGESLAGQKKHAEAEPLLVQGYQSLKQLVDNIPPGVRMERLTEALDRLIKHYDEWSKPEEAAKWKAEKVQLEASLKAEREKLEPSLKKDSEKPK